MSNTLNELLQTIVEHTQQQGPRATMLGVGAQSDAHARTLLDELRELPGGRGAIEQTELLGEGGMGEVHLAMQHGMERDVAIKRVKPSMRDARTTLRLLQEAWVTGMLEHPNIIPVHDVGVDELGVPFMVLKRIGGDAWVDYIYDEVLLEQRFHPSDPLEWHLRVLLDVCDGIAFAHSRGIIHRDLKPDNVMVGSFGEVLVMDWGLAITLRDDEHPRIPRRLTTEGPVGTPSYMAPEMIPHDDAPPLSERTDVYLLGACLFEVVCRDPPHSGYEPKRIIRHILQGELAFPHGSPAGLVRICERAMARHPDDRYADVKELAAAVRSYLRHRSSDQAAALAHRRAESLFEVLAEDPKNEVAIHEHFGAVRFGYRHALQSWSGNEQAVVGLVRAAEALAVWELERGAPRAAARCLAEVDGISDEMRNRVQHAVHDAERAEAAAADYQRSQDRSIGLVPRRLAMLAVGLTVSLTPLTYRSVELATFGEPHHTLSYIASGTLLVFALGAVGLMRWLGGPFNAVSKTVAEAVLLVPVAQLVVTTGGTMMDMDPRSNQVLYLLMWATIATVLALRVDNRLWLGAAGYGVCFFAASLRPDWMFEAFAVANGMQTVAALWTWGRR